MVEVIQRRGCISNNRIRAGWRLAGPNAQVQGGDPHQGRTSDERVLSWRTGDGAVEAERPKAKGVGFVKQPSRMAYGGIDAVLDDSCGNLLDLDQD
jgi:hypothetical protein